LATCAQPGTGHREVVEGGSWKAAANDLMHANAQMLRAKLVMRSQGEQRGQDGGDATGERACVLGVTCEA
jgi:hypothetical protein